MRTKINKRLVDALRPHGPREHFVWDSEVRGFGVKCLATGRLVYLVQTRFGGITRRFTIGTHGSPWTPEGARDEAKRILGRLAAGEDPRDDKLEARKAITLNQLCDVYFASACGHKRSATKLIEEGLILRHVRPLLGHVKIANLTRAMGMKLMEDIAAGHTAKDVKTRKFGKARVRGGQGSANRTMTILCSILSFAVQDNLIPANPMLKMPRYRARVHERFLSLEEFKAVGEAMARLEAKGSNKVPLDAIRLLMLTGCRKSEILTLKWEWVNFDLATLDLPHSKTGAKRVPLGQSALDFLKALPRLGPPYVFPNEERTGPYTKLRSVWLVVQKDAGLAGVRLHDLRHSYASLGVSQGASLYMVGKVLGHSKAQTTQRYAHLAERVVHQAADGISASVANSLGL